MGRRPIAQDPRLRNGQRHLSVGRGHGHPVATNRLGRGPDRKEWRWLPELAPGLPVSVPVPLAKGNPSRDYPFPWLVYPWPEGVSLDRAVINDWGVLAQEFGEFIIALARRPTEGGPPPNSRGNPMAQYDAGVQWALR
jgi:aminoglycoside phosphotransferase (APT) family kinase protein